MTETIAEGTGQETETDLAQGTEDMAVKEAETVTTDATTVTDTEEVTEAAIEAVIGAATETEEETAEETTTGEETRGAHRLTSTREVAIINNCNGESGQPIH